MKAISSQKLAFLNFTSGVLGSATQAAVKVPPRILLVDDEPRVLSSLCELFKARDYQLVTAGNGREALDRLGKGEFDLLILDMRLPDMSGHEIMDFINANNVDTDVIVISGNSDIDTAIGALKRGAFDYLRKPYAREELLNTVDNALKQRALEADNRRYAWQLENSEKIYRYLVDNSPDIIYTLDDDGLFTFMNNRAQQLLGFTRDELIGKHYSVLVHDDDIEPASNVFKERRTGERASSNVELRLKSLKGYCENHTFENSLMTISLNSMGMYSLDEKDECREFFGTYGVARDITDRKKAEDRINNLAFYDPLTHLPNRRLLMDRLQQALASSVRSRREGALLFIDLDNFKTLNDTLGHDVGDLLLQQVAERLTSCVREGDTVARFGGDEFVVMLEDLSEHAPEAAAQTKTIGEKIIAMLNHPYQLAAHEHLSTPSIGATLFIEHKSGIEELLKQADIAMYQAKKTGRNTLRFFDPQMQDTVNIRATLESELRKALESHQFQLYYQIQMDSSRHPMGAEALIRWIHPERGLVSPLQFIPLAEEIGLIIPIGQWVLEMACAQLKTWQQDELTRGLVLAVNVSAKQFRHADFVSQVLDVVERHAINPELLKLELTEGLLLENIEDTIATMNALNGIGVQFSLDDFGTGYSSLQYIKRLPLDQLKIDQSFVRDLASDSSDKAIVRTIIAMAASLDLGIIAEGVESDAQRQILLDKGCTHYQGYFFGKPVPIEQFNLLLKQGCYC